VTKAPYSPHPVRAVLAAVGLAAGLGACSSTPPTPAPASTTSAAGSTTTASPTSSGSGSATSTGSRTGAGNLCTIASAKAVVEPSPGGNSAGHIGLQVTVTNAGSTPCVVEGFPGVSLVTGTEGQQLGAPAKRTSAAPAAITLAPGATARAPLQLAQAANFPDCTVTPAMGFRVYLPDDTAAQFAPQSQQGCANPAVILMEVGPFAR
jgi:hypothetical protein